MSTTDDTRQRSIAEILGWERDTHYDEERWIHPTAGVAHYPDRGWDCDDLLVWLRAQGWSVYTAPGTSGYSSVDLYRGGDIGPGQHAPTLLAALEQAVRAVAEATDE